MVINEDKYSHNPKNIEVFFLLVRAGLFGRTEGIDRLLSDEVDWTDVYQLALEQSVVGLVAEGIENFQKEHNTPLVPEERAIQFISAALQLEQRNLAMNRFIARLVGKLRKNGINTLLLKGQEVALSYEKPLWRACGDVDLLLSEEDYQKAKDYLPSFASHSEPEHEYKRHVGMMIGRWLVELHGSLRCGFSSRVDRQLDKLYRETFHGSSLRSWMNGDVQVFMLREDIDVLYVFTHILNHFFKGGVGVRQVCDWCRLLWSFRDSLDLRFLESRLKDMGLISEWKAFGMYAVQYLGMPEGAMPFFTDSGKWRQKARQIHALVIMSGDIGYHSKAEARTESFLLRKIRSSAQRTCGLARIFQVFPLDALRCLPSILINGIRQK